MGVGPCTGIGATHRRLRLWRKLTLFFPQQPSVTNMSSPRSRTLWASPSSILGFELAWFSAGFVHSVTATEFMCVVAYHILKILFCSSYPLALSLNNLTILFFMIPWGAFAEEGCDMGVPLRAEQSLVSCSLHIDQMWVSVLITTY